MCWPPWNDSGDRSGDGLQEASLEESMSTVDFIFGGWITFLELAPRVGGKAFTPKALRWSFG